MTKSNFENISIEKLEKRKKLFLFLSLGGLILSLAAIIVALYFGTHKMREIGMMLALLPSIVFLLPTILFFYKLDMTLKELKNRKAKKTKK